jgi:imidazolonepropionase-like amidohydrolase
MRGVAYLVLACAVVATAGAGVSGQAVQHEQTLVLDGAQVIDGTGAAPIPSARVVVEGGRIAAIGPMDRTPRSRAPPAWTTGKTIVPGLIDLHFPHRERSPLALGS